jgi:hypothetical protein
VWTTAQRDARAQRAGRYVPATTAHPARMLPELAAQAIAALTEPGQLVLDPMCGAGTTVVEAMHLGRPALGVDFEARWASLARDNVEFTRRAVGGHGHIITADARALPDALPSEFREQMLGRVSLLLTSPPYGPATHGLVRTEPGAGVHKRHFTYATRSRPANLAYQPLGGLAAGLTRILTGSRPLLAPDAHVLITARPWRSYGELIDLPGLVTDAAIAAGLRPVQRCVALLAGVRDGRLIARSSFFQRSYIAKARAAGEPWSKITHEDLLVFANHQTRASPRPPKRHQPQSAGSASDGDPRLDGLAT